jgi:pheromone shutdown-related protein TraB
MSFENRIKIVGTNHISLKSQEDIKKAFLEFKPTNICVELDSQRLYSILHPQSQKISLKLIKSLGFKGFLFMLLAKYVQQKLGRLVGVKPGSEMLFAINLAKNNNLTLNLIDKPIDKTIKRLMKKLSFKEKWFFVVDLFKGFLFKSKQPKIKINLAEVPSEDLIYSLLIQLKSRYPTVYSVLIDERNHFMAKKIVLLLKKNPENTFLIVIGAGHKKEIFSLINFYYSKIEIV